MALPDRKAVRFFEAQFQRQVASGEAALNPFERRVLPYVKGSVLDLGCGLGNLSLAAAARGCRVRAVDASPTAVGHLREVAVREGLAIEAREADLTTYRVEGRHDTGLAHAGAAAVAAVVSSGLDGVGFTAALPWALECARLAAEQGHWVAGADIGARVAWAIELVQGVRDRSGGEAALDAVARLVGTSLATQESVPAAFAVASLHTDEPWQAVLAAARLGGDSDTIAAMTGAMLGAGHGMSAWPEAAVQQVRDVNGLDLDPVADGLVRLRQRLGAPS